MKGAGGGWGGGETLFLLHNFKNNNEKISDYFLK